MRLPGKRCRPIFEICVVVKSPKTTRDKFWTNLFQYFCVAQRQSFEQNPSASNGVLCSVNDTTPSKNRTHPKTKSCPSEERRKTFWIESHDDQDGWKQDVFVGRSSFRVYSRNTLWYTCKLHLWRNQRKMGLPHGKRRTRSNNWLHKIMCVTFTDFLPFLWETFRQISIGDDSLHVCSFCCINRWDHAVVSWCCNGRVWKQRALDFNLQSGDVIFATFVFFFLPFFCVFFFLRRSRFPLFGCTAQKHLFFAFDRNHRWYGNRVLNYLSSVSGFWNCDSRKKIFRILQVRGQREKCHQFLWQHHAWDGLEPRRSWSRLVVHARTQGKSSSSQTNSVDHPQVKYVIKELCTKTVLLCFQSSSVIWNIFFQKAWFRAVRK